MISPQSEMAAVVRVERCGGVGHCGWCSRLVRRCTTGIDGHEPVRFRPPMFPDVHD